MYYNPNMPYMGGDMYNMPATAGYGQEEAANQPYMPMTYPTMPAMANMPMAANMPMMPMMPMMQANYMMPYYMEKEKKCVKVPEVIGRNHCQILLETEIPFAPGYPALDIKDIMKDVRDLVMSVCTDKVLINGKLHKNINYKTFDCTGRVKCHCEDLEVVYGDVRHVGIDIPFAGYIDIPGARPGDYVEVEFAGVEDACELDMLKDPCYVRGCKYPVYKKLKEKVIVKIDVKVLRPVQITVDPERKNICP